LIALSLGLLIGYITMISVEPRYFAEAVKEAPHDGLDGLSAFVEALMTGLAALAGTTIGAYALQRIATKAR
jgi:hypothetical protein